MYTNTNFKSKKALKDAVKEGQKIGVHSAGPFDKGIKDGEVMLEGPHYPKPHTWYATAVLENGIIVSIK
jgi:hypothetical protein